MIIQILLNKLLIACSVAATFAALLFLSGCNDGIDVRQDYDFSISTWHLPAEVSAGEKVEIRFTLRCAGHYAGTFYRIAYIQIEGTGEVCDTEGLRLQPQEFRSLGSLPELDARNPREQVFTLYYTPQGDEPSEVQFIVQDNFGQERTLMINFGQAPT